ncbi:PREDICTED: zona pellucida sperm-binding protein 3-like, partial [Tauraco erythrolophus]|uniref:zona pellucida sperm-binding protein 3-like n=1 Tax=Tauraco erythrolophus TaxID=121530 RepID=UPI000523356D
EPQSRAISSQLPVTVQCQEAQLVVTVHRDLFGTGRLVKPAEPTTPPSSPSSAGVAPPSASQCFSTQITPDSLIYRTLLNYDPSPASNPVIIRSNPAVIPIECHYPRRENVSSNAIRPTWAPFSHTLCLVDGRSDDTSSAFITPRPREDMLRFRIDVFRFAGDARNL